MDWRKLTKLFHWKSGSIRRRLLTWGLTLFGLALIITILAGSLYTRRLIKTEAAELQKEIALRVAEEIQDFVRREVDRLSDLAVSASLHEMGSETQRLLALLLLKNDRAFTDVSILDDKGMEVVKVSERRVYLPAEFSDQSGSEKFAKARKGESYISPVYTSDRAEPYITVAVPMKITPRAVVGVVSAEANLKSLWEVIGEIAFGRAGYAYLVDGQGNLIAHRDPSLVLKRTSLAHIHAVQEFLRTLSGTEPTPTQEGRGIINKPVLSTFVPVSGLGWAVILEEPVDVALAEVRRLERYVVLLLAAVLLIGAAAIVWASDRITKPIRELHRGAEIIAAGNLDHRVAVQTGDEIQQLADGFNKMASALKGSYVTLEEKVEQRTKELSALYDVTATVNRTLELEPVVQEVIKKITDIFHFDATRIFLLNPQTDELQMRASFETRPEFWAQVRSFRRGQGIVGRVADEGEPILFDDVRTDPRYQEWSQSKASQKAGFAFLAGFPIKTKERTVGTLLLVGQSPRKLTADEVQLLTSMAEQAGVAVENSRLFAEVMRKSQELEALVETSKNIASLLDREVLLPRIAEEARKILAVEGCAFRLLEGDELVLLFVSDRRLQSGFRSRLKIGESLTGRVVVEKRAIAVRRLGEDPRVVEEHREILRQAGYSSFLGIPMPVGDSIIGTVTLFSKAERDFEAEEIRLMTAFADQAAIAIQNANLFAEINLKTGELERANQELIEANRAKSEFMAAMSHELRTPLNVIIGNADLIRDRFFGEITPKQRDSLEKILRYSQMLLKLINDVLALARLEAKKMFVDVSTFRLDDILGHIKAYADHLNTNNHLKVVWKVDESLPAIATDALKLEEILQNLIGNAFKFTPQGTIEVRVRDLPERERIEISVADTGIGMEQQALEKIFDQFYQQKDAHTGSRSGVGLGLSIVKKYLEMMQGEIRVESEPHKGSTFTFTLPHSI